MVSVRVAGLADRSERLSLRDDLTRRYGSRRHVSVKRTEPAAVVDEDVIAPAVVELAAQDRAGSARADRRAGGSRDVDAAVES